MPTGWTAGWDLKKALISSPYQGQSYSVPLAEWIPV
jgi:hypothetical protein